MANLDDSTIGSANVNRESALSLTLATEHGLVAGSPNARAEMFLRRLLPEVSRATGNPLTALVPWACDVLQSKQSLRVYGQDIRDFFAHMRHHDIGPLAVTGDHVKLYKAALREAGLAGATVARKLSVLRGVYRQFAAKKLVRWEVAQDIVAVESPCVQKNTTPALTEKQASLLLHAPNTSTLRGLRDKALIHTLFITACRVSAMTNAKVGHLEFDGAEWFLNVTEKRGRKQRKILLEAARTLLAYLQTADIDADREGPLFRRFAPNGKSLLREPLCRETVWRIVKKYARQVGIPTERLGGRGVGVHSLRKTALNNAIQNGAQLHEARELAGHADVRTTELYFVRREEDAERAARRIAIR